jgi:hypothetical protein
MWKNPCFDDIGFQGLFGKDPMIRKRSWCDWLALDKISGILEPMLMAINRAYFLKSFFIITRFPLKNTMGPAGFEPATSAV